MGGFMDDEYVAEAQQLVVTEGFRLAQRGGVPQHVDLLGGHGVRRSTAARALKAWTRPRSHYRTCEDCLEAVNSGRADIHEHARRLRREPVHRPVVQQHHAGHLRASRGQPLVRHRAAGGRRPVLGAQQGREQPFARRARRRLLAQHHARVRQAAHPPGGRVREPAARRGARPRAVPVRGRHRDRGVGVEGAQPHDGDEAGEGGGDGPREDGLPLAHVSRDPHAHERHHRPVERGVAVGRGHAVYPLEPREDQHVGAVPAVARERHPRHVEDRERQDAYRDGVFVPARWPSASRACSASSRGEGHPARGSLRRRRRRGGRRCAAAAGAGEPAVQRAPSSPTPATPSG